MEHVVHKRGNWLHWWWWRDRVKWCGWARDLEHTQSSKRGSFIVKISAHSLENTIRITTGDLSKTSNLTNVFFHNECLIPGREKYFYNYYPWLFWKEVNEGERPVFFLHTISKNKYRYCVGMDTSCARLSATLCRCVYFLINTALRFLTKPLE